MNVDITDIYNKEKIQEHLFESVGKAHFTVFATVLGSGSFSTVFLGVCTTTGKRVAIKKIDLHKQKDLDRIILEIDMMQKMNHPNIVVYHDIIKKPDYWYIIMEHCNYGTLEDIIKHNKKKLMSDSFGNQSDIFVNLEKETHYYLNQLKNALNYIRKLGYVHRDIKPQNILLVYNDLDNPLTFSTEKSDYHLDLLFDTTDTNIKEKNYHIDQKIIVKLADFGLAKHVTGTDLMSKTICGTPFYMAPELLIDGEYNSKVDLWAFGVIMYEMLFQTYPIEATTLPQLKTKMRQLDINFNVSNNFTKKCFDLLIKLLNKDHKLRINWEFFFNHEWFIHWKQMANPDDGININEKKSVDGTDQVAKRSSNLSRMKLTRYDMSNTPPRTYGEICFAKNKTDENNLVGHRGLIPEGSPSGGPQPTILSDTNTIPIPIARPFPKQTSITGITKSVSMPLRTNHNLMSSTISNSDSVSSSNSTNKHPNSCPSQLNKSGIIRTSSFSPTTIIDNYNNPTSIKSAPIAIQQPKISYSKSAMSYIMSPISYISGTYNSPSNK